MPYMPQDGVGTEVPKAAYCRHQPALDAGPGRLFIPCLPLATQQQKGKMIEAGPQYQKAACNNTVVD